MTRAGHTTGIDSDADFPMLLDPREQELEDRERQEFARPELDPEERSEEPVLRELGRVFRTYRRPYLWGVLLAAAISLALAFFLPARYEATGSLMSVGSGLPQSALSRFIRMPFLMPNRQELPAEILISVLESRRISDPILDRAFARWPGDRDPLPLKNILTRTRPGQEPARETLYRQLARATRFRLDPETRIITIAVETRYPYLSAQVVNTYLDAVSRYATEELQSRSRLEALTLSRRIAQVDGEMRAEEERLHAFYSANQNYATSTDPDIRIEQLRLERNLELKARVIMELVGQKESALVGEGNEAPVVDVIDHGAPPELRSWPNRKLFIGGGIAGALIGGFVLMLAADHLGIRSRSDVFALTR